MEHQLLDYYRHYCELTIWFKKIVLHADPKQVITIQDIAAEFIAERNRILLYIPEGRRKILRKQINAIALSYFSKVSRWTKKQKITIDMV
jgi:hypothetical protein